jgi:hypothetical protein
MDAPVKFFPEKKASLLKKGRVLVKPVVGNMNLFGINSISSANS